jgi:hypothetical protein
MITLTREKVWRLIYTSPYTVMGWLVFLIDCVQRMKREWNPLLHDVRWPSIYTGTNRCYEKQCGDSPVLGFVLWPRKAWVSKISELAGQLFCFSYDVSTQILVLLLLWRVHPDTHSSLSHIQQDIMIGSTSQKYSWTVAWQTLVRW